MVTGERRALEEADEVPAHIRALKHLSRLMPVLAVGSAIGTGVVAAVVRRNSVSKAVDENLFLTLWTGICVTLMFAFLTWRARVSLRPPEVVAL